VPDLLARPLGREALCALFVRKPHLRRALVAQVWSAPKPLGPAARLGVGLASLRTDEDFRRAANRILAALARGEATPAEAARLARLLATRGHALNRNLGANFPSSSADCTGTAVSTGELGGTMLVEDILAQKGGQVFAVAPDCTVREMARFIATRNIGTTIVADARGEMLGIISERDLVRGLSEFDSSYMDMPVSALMTRSIIPCAPETTISEALSLMASHRIRHLPVIKDGNAVGLISVRDLLEFRLEGLEANFASVIRGKRESSRAQHNAELVNRAKGEFIASIGDEFRPPLETILGLAECLADDAAASSSQDDYRREIEETARRLLSVIDDVATLSRLQMRALDPARESFDPAELAISCATEFLPQAEQKNIGLRVEPDRTPPLAADPGMVRHMLRNLLANAVRFTPAGGAVSVAFAVDREGGMRVSVADSGTGIAPEHLAKVTEPFYRVTASTARDRAGAGLGLALVDAMMLAHGGSLILESRVGIGTTATLRFPAGMQETAPHPATSDRLRAA
jgi:signal transduction histidine kinase